MVLFEFNKIIKSKYKNYITNKKNSILSFDEFKNIYFQQISKIFYLYFTGISKEYIDNIISNNKTKIIFFCLNDNFNLKDIISIIIYHKTISQEKIKYYILAYGINKRFRKYGYGKYSLDEFIQWIKSKNNNSKQKEILLKSVESSLSFYLEYGFTQTNLISNKLFFRYESKNELKNNQEKILKFNINPYD